MGLNGQRRRSLASVAVVVLATFSVAVEAGVAGPADGPRLLNALDVGAEVELRISPDSRTAVYTATVEGEDEDIEFLPPDVLVSVPVAGGPATQLNVPGINGARILDFQISADSSTVVSLSDLDRDHLSELYSVPINGGTPTELTEPLADRIGVKFGTYDLSPDSTTVVFVAGPGVGGKRELYSVPIAGGTLTNLSGRLVTSGDVDTSGVVISSDSSRVVYRADALTNGVKEIFSVPIGGGKPTRLNGQLADGGDVKSSAVTPDGARVVYRADQDVDGVFELFSVPIAGGTPVKLTGNMVRGGDARFFAITEDSSRVVYQADAVTNGVFELFSVPVKGGTPTRISGPLVPGGTIDFFFLSPDSRSVVYFADGSRVDRNEIYSAPIRGGAVTRLNGPLVKGGDVAGFTISPDSSRVVYFADERTNNEPELFSVPTRGGPSTPLGFGSGGGGFMHIIATDSSWVIARRSDALVVIPIEGGPLSHLGGSLAGFDVVEASPDSATVVFQAAGALYAVDIRSPCNSRPAGFDVPGADTFHDGDLGGTVTARDRLGAPLAAGDFDADGYDELVVWFAGRALLDDGAAGALRVIPGSPDGPSLAEVMLLDRDVLFGDGENRAGDGFGNALAVGDFNGDGFADLAIGVPNRAVAGAILAGEVNVLYGSETGLTTAVVTVLSQAGPTPGSPEAFDGFGGELAAGDFDGDGVDDLAIGVPFEAVRSNTIEQAGMVNVVYGTAGVGLTTEGSQGFSQRGPIRGKPEEGDRFGSVLVAGDFDGDGDDDLAVGVPKESLGRHDEAGAVNIILGSPGQGLTVEGNYMISQKGPVPGKAEEGDQFGAALAAGRFNNDVFDDLVVGIPQEVVGHPRGVDDDGDAETGQGGITVIYGSTTGLDKNTGAFFSQRGPIAGAAEEKSRFGATLAARDLNNDGHDDVAIGVPRGGTNGSGAVIILLGGSTGLTSARSTQFNQSGPLPGTPEFGDRFGASIVLGDFYGDDKPDLAIGAPTEDVGARRDAGRVTVIPNR